MEDGMSIAHNVYEDGYIQSLGFFATKEGCYATVGVIIEGRYILRVATGRETIRVLTGGLTTLDGNRRWDSTTEPLVFEEGDIVQFNAEPGTSYICYYDLRM